MSKRIQRINELLKREISQCVERNFEFPNILVTIHAVDVAANLKHAKVFIGVIGSETDKRKTLEKLNSKRGMIQNNVMKRVVLKYTPQLHFFGDDSIERGNRVVDLLEEIGEVNLDDDPPVEK